MLSCRITSFSASWRDSTCLLHYQDRELIYLQCSDVFNTLKRNLVTATNALGWSKATIFISAIQRLGPFPKYIEVNSKTCFRPSLHSAKHQNNLNTSVEDCELFSSNGIHRIKMCSMYI